MLQPSQVAEIRATHGHGGVGAGLDDVRNSTETAGGRIASRCEPIADSRAVTGQRR